MKKLNFKTSLLLLVMALSFSSLKAQLSGTKTIPTDYASIAAFVTDLNTVGVGAGGVTLNVPAGYTETATAVISLTATGTVANPIVIQKSGAGANPIITSYTAGTGTPGTAIQDGVFALVGSDYVTIDGIDLAENAANTTNPSTMEYGYGLFKASATDGCQNNVIKNCTVTLNKINNATGTAPAFDGSRGINVVNSLISTQTTVITVTAVSGSNSNNQFYTNTLQNLNIGIALSGFAATTPFTLGDTGNDVGGSSALTGNTIINFGGAAAAGNPAAGIRTVNQWSPNISYNTINNNTGAGVNHVSTLRGILIGAATSANATITFNSVTVNSGATTSQMDGISNASGSTAAANTININNNTVYVAYSTATTGTINAILNSGTAAIVNINGNTVSNIASLPTLQNVIAGTGTVLFITGGSPTTLNINNNTISTFARTSLLGGTTRGIVMTSPTNTTISGNTIENIAFSAPVSTGNIDGIYGLSSAVNVTITNNIVRNLSTPTTGIINGIREWGGTGNKIITGNQVYSFATTAGGAGGATFNGIYTSTGTVTIQNNSIYNLVSTGSTGGTGGTVYAVQSSGSTATTISSNKIYDLASNSTNPTVGGILISGGTTNTATNNLIGDLRAPFANAANPVIGINITGGTTALVYYNTVNLEASSSGALFGSSAISVSTTPNLTLNNNIFINSSSVSGAGLAVAYRRSTATLTSYQATSNRNDFVASTVYTDGTTPLVTLLAYQTAMATRDANSISEAPNFLSTTGSNVNFLHINTSLPSGIESGGINIAGITTDFDANIRQGNLGYVGTGTAPDMGADEFETSVIFCSAANGGTISPSTNSNCQGTTRTITSIGVSNLFGNSYQWKISAVSGGPYVNVTGGTGATTTSYTTASLTPGTYYYVLETTCSVGSLTGLSNEYTLVVNPTPVVSITPSSATYCNPGTAVSLVASGASSYAWSPATGLSAATGASVNASPSVTTTYTVLGSDLGCPSLPTTVTVTVATAPTISSITATPAALCNSGNSQLSSTVGFGPFTYCVSTHTSGCSGDNIANVSLGSILNATGTACGGTSHYTYFPPSATTTTTLSNSGGPYSLSLTLGTDGNQYSGAWIDFNQNGAFEVSEFLGATANAGASGVIALSFTVPVGAFNGITRMRIIGGNDAAVLANQACGASSSPWGETQDYDVTITGGVDPFTFSWSPATFLNTTTITNPLATGLNATTTYTLSAIANSCTTTANVTVTANPLPTAPTTTNSAQCGAQIPTASVSSTTLLPTPTFVWYDAAVAGAVLQTSTSTTYTSVIGATTTLYVGEKNMTTGCESALTPVTITVASADLVQASINLPTICIGQTVNLSVVNLNATPLQAYTYSWSSTTGNGLAASAGSAVTATPTTPGLYVYTVNGVDGGCNAVSTVNLTVNPFTATLSAINVTCFNAGNGSFSLTSSTCGTAPFTYSVDGGAFGPIPTNLVPGTYSVVTRDANLYSVAPQSIIITQPVAIAAANVIGTTVCQNATSAQITAGPSSGSVSAVFGTNVNILGSATSNYSVTPVIPAGAIVTSTILRFSNVSTFSFEYPSDMLVSLTGGSTLASVTMAPVNAVVTNAGPYDRAASNYTSGAVNLQIVNTYSATATLGSITLEITYTIPSPTITNYYTAITGGTFLGTGTPFETVGTSVLPNTNTPGVYNFYAAGVNGICESAARSLVTVTVNALPSVNAGADQTVCAGTAVTLNGTVAGGTWFGPVPVTNGTAFTPPAGSSTFTYSVTNGSGCTNVDTVIVNVNALPSVNAGSDQSVCAGASVTLTATGVGTFTWDNGVSQATPFTPTGTATYTVTVDNGVCTSTDNVVVNVNALPTVNAGADQSVCAGTNVTLTATGAGTFTWDNGVSQATLFTPAGTATYTVTVDNGVCTSTDNVVVNVNALPIVNAGVDQTVCEGNAVTLSGTAAGGTWTGPIAVTNGTAFTPPAGVHTFTYSVTNVAGCTNTDTVVVNVDALPTVNAGADQTICEGTTVTLSGAAAGGTWTGPVTITDGVAFTPPAGLHTFIYSVTNGSGCTNTDTVVVTVYTLPSADAGADQTICEGSAVTLSGNPAGNSWTGPVVITDGVAFTPPAGTHTFIYSVTNGSSCANTDTVVVTVDAAPVADAGADIAVCDGAAVTFNGTGGTSPIWMGPVAVTNGTPVVLPVGVHLFDLTITGSNGCTDTDTIQVTVNALPTAVAADNGNATITASTGTAYQWIDCGTGLAITGATSQTYTVTTNGSYSVVVNSGACSDTSDCVIIDYMNVSEMSLDVIRLYPNPTRDNVTVTMSSASASIEIIDAQGKLLRATQVDNGDKIDLSTYETGMYIFKITTENGTTIHRISKN